MTEPYSTLVELDYLGPATSMVDVLHDLRGKAMFFEDFTRSDIDTLARYMEVYQAEPGQIIIREGDQEDFMLFVMDGRVNIIKVTAHGDRRSMATVGPGVTLGEMSMIDGHPRFASCIAIDLTIFGVFSRSSMVQIIMERPALGTKILIKLVTLLSQRLRETSASLIGNLDKTDTV